MRYGPGLLEEVLRRTDLVQLVGRRVKLVRKGRVMWGCCPFHKEKSPSFKVENERRTYKCFGCGKGGDAFKWLMETEGLTFPESVERLAGEAGVELPKWTPDDEAREAQKKSLYDIIEVACTFFEERLRSADGAAAREYLKSRGLNGEVATQFRLGYAPDSKSALKDHLYAKNISLDEMVAAGLVRPQDEDRSPRDFFYNRLMFPITDPRGRVVAFGARALDPNAKPKYINTGDTTLFSKGQQLYNFATSRPAGIKTQTIVVAEGYMDVIALVRAGFEAAVAPLGTALTEEQLHLLWRVAPEPILSFDGDDAGLRAAHRAARLALAHLKPGYSLRFAFLPGGEDPDSFIRGNGAAGMKKILDAAEPLARVLWRAETDGKDFSTPERRAGLEKALSEVVGQIQDGKIADYYRRDFEQQVYDTFKRRKPPTPREGDRYTGSGDRNIEPRRNQGHGESRSEGQGSGKFQGGRGQGYGRNAIAPVTSALKNSLLARSSRVAPRHVKETELAELLFDCPELAARHGELLASLTFQDPVLDRLRHELLNLAASGFKLEKAGLENHLVRAGLADLVDRLKGRHGAGSVGADAPGGAEVSVDGEDVEARWLKAAAHLREIAELDPERIRAMERFKADPTEETWQEARRLLGSAPQKE